jgi:hypothetical protein
MDVQIDRAQLRFEEAIAAFEQRLRLVGTATYRDLTPDDHLRSFAVAGAMKADLLADLREAVRRAVEEGETLETFRKDFWGAVDKHGWHGWTGEGSEAGEAWRTRVIYTTNLRKSFSTGRYAQLTDPQFVAQYPYWEWIHSGLAKEPRPQHLAWHGMTLRHDHPFWQAYFPPRIPPDYNCLCRVKAVRRPAEGAATAAPQGWQALVGPGEGVARDNVAAEVRALVAAKLTALPAQLGAAMYQARAATLLEETTRAFGAFVDAVAKDGVGRGDNLVVGALKLRWIEAARQRGIIPATAEIMVRDKDVVHTFRPGKAQPLSLDWYKQLPRHLQNPQAVVLDTTHERPAFLLVFDAGQQAKKLVVQVNYEVRKTGTYNVVDTGRILDSESIKGKIGRGYELVDGQL